MQNNLQAIDITKYIASLCVVAVHVFTVSPIESESLFLFINGIARMAVPFFFCCTGYFLAQKGFDNDNVIIAYIKKLLRAYLVLSAVYIPIEFLIMAGTNTLDFQHITEYLHKCLVQGSFMHLWYLPATIFAVGFIYILLKKMSIQFISCIAVFLYIIGMLGDSYFGIMPMLPKWSNTMIDVYQTYFISTRNGLFFGVPFMLIGILNFRYQKKVLQMNSFPWLILSLIMVCLETFILQVFEIAADYNMMFTLVPATIFLFSVLLKVSNLESSSIKWKKYSSFIYEFHLIPYGILLILASVCNFEVLHSKGIQFIIVLICLHASLYFLSYFKKSV